MEFIIEQMLLIAFGLSAAFLNIYAGFLGLVLGDYLSARKTGLPLPFSWLHKMHERLVRIAATSKDMSPVIFALICANVGVAYLFLVWIGPQNENPWVEPERKIK